MNKVIGYLTDRNHEQLTANGQADIYRDDPTTTHGVVATALYAEPFKLVSYGRDAFEESVRQRYHDHPYPEYLLIRNVLNEYKNIGIQGEWIGWQAAFTLRVEPKQDLRLAILDLFAHNTGDYIPEPGELVRIEEGLDTLLTTAHKLSDIQLAALIKALDVTGIAPREVTFALGNAQNYLEYNGITADVA